MCYHCTPNMTTQSLCNDMNQYTMTTCKYDNSTCYMSTIMAGMLKAYALGCVDHPVSKDNPLHIALHSLSEGGGTPLHGLHGDVPLDDIVFYLSVLNRVYNFVWLCEQGIACTFVLQVLQAYKSNDSENYNVNQCFIACNANKWF